MMYFNVGVAFLSQDAVPSASTNIGGNVWRPTYLGQPTSRPRGLPVVRILPPLNPISVRVSGEPLRMIRIGIRIANTGWDERCVFACINVEGPRAVSHRHNVFVREHNHTRDSILLVDREPAFS